MSQNPRHVIVTIDGKKKKFGSVIGDTTMSDLAKKLHVKLDDIIFEDKDGITLPDVNKDSKVSYVSGLTHDEDDKKKYYIIAQSKQKKEEKQKQQEAELKQQEEEKRKQQEAKLKQKAEDKQKQQEAAELKQKEQAREKLKKNLTNGPELGVLEQAKKNNDANASRINAADIIDNGRKEMIDNLMNRDLKNMDNISTHGNKPLDIRYLKQLEIERIIKNLRLFCGRQSNNNTNNSNSNNNVEIIRCNCEIFSFRKDFQFDKTRHLYFCPILQSIPIDTKICSNIVEESLISQGYNNWSSEGGINLPLVIDVPLIGSSGGRSRGGRDSLRSNYNKRHDINESSSLIAQTLYPKGEIILNSTVIQLSEQFEDDLIKWLIDESMTDDQFYDRYGKWVDLNVIIGGRVYSVEKQTAQFGRTIENRKENFTTAFKSKLNSLNFGFSSDISNSNQSDRSQATLTKKQNKEIKLTVVGGDSSYMISNQMSKWVESVQNNFELWDVIEIRGKKSKHILSLYEFMSDECKLQITKEVLEFKKEGLGSDDKKKDELDSQKQEIKDGGTLTPGDQIVYDIKSLKDKYLRFDVSWHGKINVSRVLDVQLFSCKNNGIDCKNNTWNNFKPFWKIAFECGTLVNGQKEGIKLYKICTKEGIWQNWRYWKQNNILLKTAGAYRDFASKNKISFKIEWENCQTNKNNEITVYYCNKNNDWIKVVSTPYIDFWRTKHGDDKVKGNRDPITAVKLSGYGEFDVQFFVHCSDT